VVGGGTGIQVDIVAERLSNYYLRKNINTRIIVVTANNEKAFHKLTNKQAMDELPNLVIKQMIKPDIDSTGIRDNRGLGAYFKHSDIVVTRPGGSTTAELLHTGTPTVTYNQGPLFKD
jgi:UDP-N-acetylglucosamine:LPS N-acetylglucosamine transferase